MSDHEFNQWLHFYELEPFGFNPQAMQFASLQALVANVSGNMKTALSPSDFLPEHLRPPKPQLTEEALASMIGAPN